MNRINAPALSAPAQPALALALALAITTAFSGCADTPQAPQPPLDKLANPVDRAHTQTPAARFIVAAANPLATEAGWRMLRAGGSAVDAAIAVQLVLGLVEPQSSGIGGGAFLLHWDGRRVEALDGRETAPAAADERLFLKADGQPMAFLDAVVGGRSVGTPGAVRLLADAHARHGKLPWATLFEPAIALAENGFVVSPHLARALEGEQPLRADRQAAALYYPGGRALAAGERLRNPAYAAVLRQLAARGADAFYRGPVAADIVRRVRSHANAGALAESDLERYRVVVREPICTPRAPADSAPSARVVICGMPPPSSGHLTVMQIIGLLDALPPLGAPALTGGVPSVDWLHRYVEASKLAYADRARYIADPDFVTPPGARWTTLLEPAYLRSRAALIGERARPSAEAGVPVPRHISAAERHAPQPEQPEHGTSHIAVVDAEGRAVAMTTTIEAVWGARLMSDGGTGLPGGFLLNNELTDFSLAPTDEAGRPIANRVEAGKRPRSSMSPTLVLDATGRLLASAGSPGGAAIIHYTAKALVGLLDWGLDPQAAVALPNVLNFNGPTTLEAGRFAPAVAEALRARGHVVREAVAQSGLQALQRTPRGWVGGADPRREGVVYGE